MAGHGIALVARLESLQLRPSTPQRKALQKATRQYLQSMFENGANWRKNKKAFKEYRWLSMVHSKVFGYVPGPNSVGSGQKKRALLREAADNVFGACPNLTTLHLNNGNILYPNFGRFNERYLLNGTVAHNFEGNPKDVICEFLPAAARAGIKLRGLTIASSNASFLSGDLRVDKAKGKNLAQTYHPTLRYLERMHLEFYCETSTEQEEICVSLQEYLICWLRQTPNPRELRLVMPETPGCREEEAYTEMKFVIGNLRFQNLSVCQLAHFHSSAKRLGTFLLQHADSLRGLELTDVYLNKGSWPTCLSLFGGRLAKLVMVKIFAPLFDIGEDEEYPADYISDVEQWPPANVRKGQVEKYIMEGCGPPPEWPDSALPSIYNNYSDEDDDYHIYSDGVLHHWTDHDAWHNADFDDYQA